MRAHVPAACQRRQGGATARDSLDRVTTGGGGQDEARARREARRATLLAFERELWARGVTRVAGVDEAGMGPLAGPVVAAAVVFRPEDVVAEADDSKKLDEATRVRLAAEVKARALAWAVGQATVAEIAEINVHQAGLLAMRRAVEALEPQPEHLLVDARRVPGVALPQDAHVKGDARSVTIAAASIVAKVHRDAIMDELAARHPGYGFERHRGYATPEHLEALRRLGPSPAHRASWEALSEHAGEWSNEYYRLREGLKGVRSPVDLRSWARDVQEGLGRLSPREIRRLELASRRRFPRGRAPADAPPPALPFE